MFGYFIVVRNQVWIRLRYENDLSASVLSIGNTTNMQMILISQNYLQINIQISRRARIQYWRLK